MLGILCFGKLLNLLGGGFTNRVLSFYLFTCPPSQPFLLPQLCLTHYTSPNSSSNTCCFLFQSFAPVNFVKWMELDSVDSLLSLSILGLSSSLASCLGNIFLVDPWALIFWAPSSEGCGAVPHPVLTPSLRLPWLLRTEWKGIREEEESTWECLRADVQEARELEGATHEGRESTHVKSFYNSHVVLASLCHSRMLWSAWTEIFFLKC